MSTKSEQFLSPHLRTTQRIVGETQRKTVSYAPPAMQLPVTLRRPIAGATRRSQGVETPQSVSVSFTLAEAVAAVSAFLAAADHALVSAARYEVGEMEEKAQRMYARACMLEFLAESVAKAARNGT